MSHVVGFITGSVIYNLLDSGFANILGLETLRHGTNPINYAGILIHGGDPRHGGKASGSNYLNETENHFHVFKDNEYKPNTDSSILRIKGIGNRLFPRLFAVLAGYNFVAQWFPSNGPNAASTPINFARFISCIGGLISCLITPTLRFRFSSIDPQRLQDDPHFAGSAYRTRQAIESWRIGLLGSLVTGINLNWFSRVRSYPGKILTGILQVTSGIAIAVLASCVVTANPSLITSVVVGAVLA